MIKQAVIKNFQAHKYLKIKFGPITTITGATDVGKSSIIKALYWALLNKPKGNSFVNDPDLPTFVGIKTEDGKVSRKRHKNLNQYKLNGKVFDIPAEAYENEIKPFTKMSELNFQSQFDSPFWFFISPGEVSKQLNQIVDLEIIDTTLSKLKHKKREASVLETITISKINDIEIELKQLDYVDKLSSDYEHLESLESKISLGATVVGELSVLVADTQTHRQQVKMLTGARSACLVVYKTLAKLENIGYSTETLRELLIKTKKYKRIAESEIPNISKLLSISSGLKKIEEEKTKLENYISETNTEQENIWQKKQELKRDQENLQNIIGTNCPLCGSRMK